jgi:hypothetical protein
MVVLLIALLATVLFISGCGGDATGATGMPPAATAAGTTPLAQAAETPMAAAKIAASEPASTSFGQTATVPGKVEVTVMKAEIASEVTRNIDYKAFRLVRVELKFTALTRLYSVKVSIAGEDGKKIRPGIAPDTSLLNNESKTFNFHFSAEDGQKNFTIYVEEVPITIGKIPSFPGNGIN